jgi:hypothetical protein
MTNPERREKATKILEEYHKSPISTMTSEGTTYSIDQALSALEALMPEVMSERELADKICDLLQEDRKRIRPMVFNSQEEKDFRTAAFIAKSLTIAKPSGEIYKYKGGEDDGYGGKTTPVTWKEAYEEQERYETWAMKEMKKACEKIKAHPKWEWGANAYPSSYERAIVAGCGQAVEELQKEIAILKAKPVMTKEEVEKVIFALKKARVFIEYARYELDDGKATIGSQFPHKEDADIETTRLKEAIDLASKLIGRG